VEKCPKNPNNKNNRTQDFNKDDLRIAKKAMQIEWLLAARRPKVEGGLGHVNLLSSRR